jgi:hypothetical protein
MGLVKKNEKMQTWIFTFIVLTGVFFGLKLAYVICTAVVLPATQGALYVSTSRVRISAFLDAVAMDEYFARFLEGMGLEQWDTN